MIILQNLSSVTGTKALKAGGDRLDTSLKEPEVENVSLILLIILEKKEANMSASFFLGCEKAKQSQQCGETPSLMAAITSSGHYCLQL